MNWGNYNGANALAFSGAGVLARGIQSEQDRLSLNLGVGIGIGERSSFGRESDESVGGRIGLQYTW